MRLTRRGRLARTGLMLATAAYAWHAFHPAIAEEASATPVVEMEMSNGQTVLVPLSKLERNTAPKAATRKHLSPAASRSHAKARLSTRGWNSRQWRCLNAVWTHESNWRSEAFNDTKVNGKNAGGIPQILGLDPDTPTKVQIERGFDYIEARYGTPCKAWAFWKHHHWY